MKLFSEALKEYSLYKESKCGNGKVTIAEVKELREEFKRVREEKSRRNSYRDAGKGANFSKVLNDYSKFKESKTGSKYVTKEEVAAIRKGLKERAQEPKSYNKKIREANVSKNPAVKKNSFQSMLEKYASYKEKRTGNSTVTIQERMMLRDEYNKLKEEKIASRAKAAEPKTLKEAIIAYSKYKESKCGNKVLTREEFDAVKAEFNKTKQNVKAAPDGNKVVASLKEAADCVRMGRRALKEGDMPLAQDMAAQAGAAVDAATGAAPDAAAIDPALAQKITDVKTAVDDLAAAAGVSAPVDLGANVPAGVPAVEGQPVDATTAAPAPVQESKVDVDAVMARINERKAALSGKDNPYNVKDITAGDPTGIDRMEFATAGNETNPSQLAKVPSAQQLAKGTDKDVVRFGKDATFTPPKGVQAVGSSKKESKSLDEQDVDRYLERLDFKKIFSQSNGVIDAPEC